jgi:hypothetical protein
MEPAELLALAGTVTRWAVTGEYRNLSTRGQVEVEGGEEAVETILTHTAQPIDLLRRKGVTKEVIFRHLHAERVAVQLKASENKAVHMARALEYWQRRAAEGEGRDDDEEEFSLEFGNDEVVNSTGIQICIQDATPHDEQDDPHGKESVDKNESAKEENGGVTLSVDPEGSLPFIDAQGSEDQNDEIDSTDAKVEVKEDQTVVGCKYGMQKFFQNISEAQSEDRSLDLDERKFSPESRESDEDSEIKNILRSVGKEDISQDTRKSKYLVEELKASFEDPNVRITFGGDDNSAFGSNFKIPVLDTSESEFDETDSVRCNIFNENMKASKEGIANQGFNEKE